MNTVDFDQLYNHQYHVCHHKQQEATPALGAALNTVKEQAVKLKDVRTTMHHTAYIINHHHPYHPPIYIPTGCRECSRGHQKGGSRSQQ